MSLVLDSLPAAPAVKINKDTTENGLPLYVATLDGGLGQLKAIFDPNSNILNIRWVETSVPRQGLGKLLMRSALDIAHQTEAELVTAKLVTRQCVDSALDVFGPDAINVEKLGDYNHPYRTQAFLNYYL